MNTKMFFILPLLVAAPEAHAVCQEADFVRSSENQVTITIQGRGYSPPCLIVKAGTQVTIQASPGHPLQGVQNGQGPANPFFRATEATAPETHLLDATGQYGYFCTRHGDHHGNDMAGQIRVE